MNSRHCVCFPTLISFLTHYIIMRYLNNYPDLSRGIDIVYTTASTFRYDSLSRDSCVFYVLYTTRFKS